MSEQGGVVTISVESLAGDSETGLEIIDPIDRQRCTIQTPASVSPSSTDSDQFLFPVDTAVTVQTAALVLPSIALTHVRDAGGTILTSTEQSAYEEFSDGTYIIELHTPIKCYLRVEGPLTVIANFDRTKIAFADETTVAVGARSYHHRPAATVTTTDDPEDVMAAVSTFGSALKTTKPGRAFPTLRGHPPTIRLGERLSIPNEFEPSGAITVEIPAEFDYIYPAASLAYYLDAELVPGSEPRLHVGPDFTHALDSDRGYASEVARVLKQTFFFDCLTRTEGLYDAGGDLHERNAIESDTEIATGLDFAALYTESAAERIASYLDIPFDRIEPYLPNWKLTAHVQPVSSSVETLPFLVNDLAVVRTLDPTDVASVSPMEASEFDVIYDPSTGSESESKANTGAVSGADTDTQTDTDTGTDTDTDTDTDGGHHTRFTRSSRSGSRDDEPDAEAGQTDELYFKLPQADDSHEQAWVGEGAPVNASKSMIEAYQHRLNRPSNDDDIAVTVVCNDTGMSEEQESVNEIYDSSDTLPFDVSVHTDLTCSELRSLFATSPEFLHYAGHIDDEGFACADGKLDAATLSEVNVDAFLLNTCHSYQQGVELVKTGAIGGIVTLNEVFNYGALEMGKTLARLLHTGFPLRVALEIARTTSLAGKQYLVIGDGGLAIGQANSGCPAICDVERSADAFQVTHQIYPTEERGIGSIATLYLPSVSDYYLVSGQPNTFELTQEELAQFFSLENLPVKINGTLHWSGQIDLNDV